MKRRRAVAVVAGLVATALASAVLRWRRNPSAYPYGLGFSLALPRPFVTRPRLREILAPESGERMLEVGAGTGYYSLHVARWLEPGGPSTFWTSSRRCWTRLSAGRTSRASRNIDPVRGDAQGSPYPDNCFDAAYLNFVFGEIPDEDAALRELRRILKPGGRLVGRRGDSRTPTWSGSESSERGRKQQDLSLSAGLADLRVTMLASPT
jgi:SAM-dependent methyltransferase